MLKYFYHLHKSLKIFKNIRIYTFDILLLMTQIKRYLLLRKKAMTNLNSILKSRAITLPTKINRVKAMFFQVVMYGYYSWSIKKAENQRIDAFEVNYGVGHKG